MPRPIGLFERLRAEFENRSRQSGDDPDQKVMELWGAEVDAFWARAGEHLQEGRLRLLFVADVLPPELRRVIEFLNGAFKDIEVLGIEVKQYKGDNALALVPRVIGQTLAVQDKKISKASKHRETWTIERFSDDLNARGLVRGERTLRSLVTFADRHGLIADWGSGSSYGTFMLRPVGTRGNYIYFYSEGTFNINPTELKRTSPFNDDAQYEQLKQLFGRLVSVDALATEKIKVKDFRDDHEAALDIFLRTLFGIQQD